jgi:hypothetical protein
LSVSGFLPAATDFNVGSFSILLQFLPFGLECRAVLRDPIERAFAVRGWNIACDDGGIGNPHHRREIRATDMNMCGIVVGEIHLDPERSEMDQRRHSLPPAELYMADFAGLQGVARNGTVRETVTATIANSTTAATPHNASV